MSSFTTIIDFQPSCLGLVLSLLFITMTCINARIRHENDVTISEVKFSLFKYIKRSPKPLLAV